MKKLELRMWIVLLCLMVLAAGTVLQAQHREFTQRPRGSEFTQKMAGFDAYMEKILKDWNCPGVGVGIVMADELVFAKGFGYRDYGEKLPFTPTTVMQIASNSKLFTAVGAGLLVEEGKLTWDEPVRDAVPAIEFYNDELNNTVTLRDMLAHRTGITRHDLIWYKSDFTRKELFERLKFMEPTEPLRQTFLYNNMMYMAVGYLMELQSGKTWEDLIRARIFEPLDMDATVYTIEDMVKQPNHAVPYTEKRDTDELYKLPFYEDIAGVAPCGAIVSNIEDISHWLIALMNDGKYNGRQVIPTEVLRATLEPAVALPNTNTNVFGFWEVLNATYGMGRETASYRGHLLTFHGGDLGGFHSQISFMPKERIGVIVFVIGDHCSTLYNLLSYNLYERLLGMELTPWSERWLEMRKKGKEASKKARSKAGADRVPNTKPSHALEDFSGEYEHPAYGILKIGMSDGKLQFDFHKIRLPLNHFHYDRFDTPNDEMYGKWSVNFATNPQGDIEKAAMSLDQAEAVFTRKPETLDPEMLAKLVGDYESPTGMTLFQVVLNADGDVCIIPPGGGSGTKLIPYKDLKFRIEEFSDVLFEFVLKGGQVTGLKQTSPSGVNVYNKK